MSPNHIQGHLQRQRGISFILMTLFVGISMAVLGVVNVGQHYWEHGRVQRIVDLASLAAAREMNGGPPFTLGQTVAQQNGLQPDETITFTCLIDNGDGLPTATDNCAEANSVRASMSRNVSGFFLSPSSEVTVVAESRMAPTVTGIVQSRLLVADLAGLNAMLVGGGQLVDVGLQVDLLALAQEMGASSLTEFMGMSLSPSALFDAAVDLAGVTPADIASDNITALDDLLEGAGSPVLMSEILVLELDGQTQGQLKVELNHLARSLGSAVLAANGTSLQLLTEGQTLQLDNNVLLSPVYQVAGIEDLYVKVLEPPQILVGRKKPGGEDIAGVTTSQLEVNLKLRIAGDAGLLQALSNAVVLGVNTSFQIGLRLQAVGGRATVHDVTCSIPDEGNTLTGTLQSSLAQFEICPCEGDANPQTLLEVDVLSITNQNALLGVLGGLFSIFNPPVVSDFDPVVVQLGKDNGTVGDGVLVDVTGAEEGFTFTGASYPQNSSVPLMLEDSLPTLFSNGDYYLSVSGGSANSLILDVINPNQLLNPITAALAPALGALGGTLDDVLAQAGIELNSVEVQIDQVDCEGAMLSK